MYLVQARHLPSFPDDEKIVCKVNWGRAHVMLEVAFHIGGSQPWNLNAKTRGRSEQFSISLSAKFL